MTSLYPTNDSYFSLQDGTVSDAEAGFYLSGSESFSQEDFLASGWPIIKPILDNPPAVTESEYLEQFWLTAVDVGNKLRLKAVAADLFISFLQDELFSTRM